MALTTWGELILEIGVKRRLLKDLGRTLRNHKKTKSWETANGERQTGDNHAAVAGLTLKAVVAVFNRSVFTFAVAELALNAAVARFRPQRGALW